MLLLLFGFWFVDIDPIESWTIFIEQNVNGIQRRLTTSVVTDKRITLYVTKESRICIEGLRSKKLDLSNWINEQYRIGSGPRVKCLAFGNHLLIVRAYSIGGKIRP